jgi:hypothetical protein
LISGWVRRPWALPSVLSSTTHPVQAEPISQPDFWVGKVWVSLCLITLLGFGLRFYRVSNQSLWTDEVSSVDTARTPLDQITELSSTANNSLPTYFLLLRPLVGRSNEQIEFRARLLSVVAGGLTVPVFMLLMYCWHRALAPAFVSGLLVAVNPLLLWYSQEARAYSLMLFFGILSLLFYEMACLRGKAGWWVGYALAAVLALLLHKTGFTFFVVALWWHGLAVLGKRQTWTSLWPHALVIAALIGILCMKSHPPSKELGRPSSILELGYTAMTYLGGYSFGPSLTDIQSFGPMQAVSRHAVQVAILVGVVVAVLLLGLARGRSLLQSRELALIVFGVGLVAVSALVSDFPFNVRYTLPAVLGFLGLVGALVSTGRPLVSRTLLAAVLSVALWADYQWFYASSYRKGDSRAVAKWLSDHQNVVKTWTVLPDYLINSVVFYLPPGSRVAQNMLPSTEPQRTVFPPVPDALILGRRHHLKEPDKMIDQYRAAAGSIIENREFVGFEIYLRAKSSVAAP